MVILHYRLAVSTVAGSCGGVDADNLNSPVNDAGEESNRREWDERAGWK